MGSLFQTVYSAIVILFYVSLFCLMIVYVYKRLTKKNHRSEQQDDLLDKENDLVYIRTESDDRQDR